MRHQRSFEAFIVSSSILPLKTTAFNRFAVVLLNVAFNFSGAALAWQSLLLQEFDWSSDR
jgi:hypothetical protein